MRTTSIFQTQRRSHLLATVLWCTALAYPGDNQSLAGNITLFSTAPPGGPLIVRPHSTSTPITVAVANSVSADPPTEFLTGWQIRLAIVPAGGAVGDVQFDAASQPARYIFDGADSFGVSVSNSGMGLQAFDFNFPYSGGVQVPDGAGANLLLVTVTASADTYGSFGVFALGGAGNSQWTDAAEPVQDIRAFANVPPKHMPVPIAELFVGLPGDYNNDGVVGAADYVVWRNNESRDVTLPGDQTPGAVTPEDYQVWSTNFGKRLAGAALVSNAPEPTSLVLTLLAIVICLWQNRTAQLDSRLDGE